MKGWITIHRSFLEWEWFQKPEMVQLYMYLLMSANHTTRKWQGIEVKRGQIITSIGELSKKLNLSPRTIRTCLERLKTTGETTNETTSRYTLITLCKYDTYQFGTNGDDKANDNPNDNQTTSERQSNDNQTTTNNNDNNEIIDNITHTQFNNLVEFLLRARVNTSADVATMTQVAKEIAKRCERRGEECVEYFKLDPEVKSYIRAWVHYEELMKVFDSTLDYSVWLALTKTYELEDVQNVIRAMANKLPYRGDKLSSFEVTFREWAAVDKVIAEKRRLGNPRYRTA